MLHALAYHLGMALLRLGLQPWLHWFRAGAHGRWQHRAWAAFWRLTAWLHNSC